MKITKKSILTGDFTTMNIDVTPQQLATYLGGTVLIQDVMPDVSAEEREFLISGITPDEWNKAFPKEEE